MTEIAPGVWAAALTPLNRNLSIDHAACAEHIRRLHADGCAGVAALGTTGEANSFSVAERRELIMHLGRESFPAERMLIGVGCCAAPDTVALTRDALAAGFHNVMMLPPFYYKPVSDDGLFAAYATMIEGVNDARLRVILYDIPPMTGFRLGVELLRRLHDAFPQIVVGVKNSSGDWSAMEATLAAMPGFKMFAGSEQFLLPTLRAGGPGCISAMANVTSPALAELYAAWRADGADALQAAAAQARAALQGFATIAALKELMAARTGRPSWRRLRPPLVGLSADDAARLHAAARGAGLL